MKKLYIIILIFSILFIPILSFTDDESDKEEGFTPETFIDHECQWVLMLLDVNAFDLAVNRYNTKCLKPNYKGPEGYTWLNYGVSHKNLQYTKWALSLPGANVNGSWFGGSLLYVITAKAYRDSTTTEDSDAYKIIKLLLDRGADPFIRNLSEDDTSSECKNSEYTSYCNGESTYEFIKNRKLEDSILGKLIFQYTGIYK